METRIATTFIKVAELGSITRAAEQLGYSQGAVTSQIKQLEENLGVLLFDRVGRGIQLTEAGKRFQEYAANLVRASEDADAFAMDEICNNALFFSAFSGLISASEPSSAR